MNFTRCSLSWLKNIALKISLLAAAALCSGYPSTQAAEYQHQKYEIDASLDTANHRVTAFQKITFTNNADAPTKELYFHIYPHRKYSEREIRFLYRYAGYFKVNPFPHGFESGDLKINSIKSAGGSLTYEIDGKDQTNLRVNLPVELNPGASVEVEIGFSVEIPHSYGRFGWNQNITSLVRWYPILSVYDKNGWHKYPYYIFHQPYFSEASLYKVNLKVAKDQVVAHTGVLKEQADNADGTKSLKIETEYPVRDFSLGVSADYQIFTMEENGLTINSYYLNGDRHRAEQAAKFALELIKFHSERFGAYPYRSFNIVPAFLGHGGCQSSNQIFIDTRVYKLPKFLERYFDFMISHETSHQWFYNIIGSDEYQEMFVDEGMNSYWILQYLEHKYGPEAKVMLLPKSLGWLIPNFSFRATTASRYTYLAKNGLDRPIIGSLSSFQEPSSIFALTYGKGAYVLEMLKKQVGEDAFMRILRRYTTEFRFRNVSLGDFISLCSQESGRDLSWFFDQWLWTKKTCDYAVTAVDAKSVRLENKGAIEMPVKTRITYLDGTQGLDDWDGKGKYRVIRLEENRKIKRVEIDPDNTILLELDKINNNWPRDYYFKLVPVYFFAYEIPVVLPSAAQSVILGPTWGGSSIGAASSMQRPYDNIFRVSTDYDFSDHAFYSTLGYEISHVKNKQMALGFEIFNYEADEEKQDLTGGRVYLRKELSPASYGIFDVSDHVTLYLTRDRKFDSLEGVGGKEASSDHLYYDRKDEAIVGITGSLGRYGPYPDPDFGWKFMPTQEVAGHFLGGHEAFWRTTLELDNYRLLMPEHQHKIATRIKLGWGEASDKKLFQLGGPDGLRGYSRKTVEGSHMLLAGIEYRLPLISNMKYYFLDNIICLDKIQTVVFFDAGKAWYSEFDGRPFKKDAGLGFRLHFDLLGFLEKMVVRIDVAQAINEQDESPRLWLGLNHSF